MKELRQKFSLRKLSVGLTSVCIGLTFFKSNVQADALDSSATNPTKVQNTVVQENTTQNVSTNTPVQNESAQTSQDSVKQTDTHSVQSQGTVEKVQNQDQSENQTQAVPDKNVQTNQTHLTKVRNSQQTLQVKQATPQNTQALTESKTQSAPTQNDSFDLSAWDTQADETYLNIIGYHGDKTSIVVPNGDDFAQGGINKNNLQTAIDANVMHKIMQDNDPEKVVFSSINDSKTKAVGKDWSHAFSKSDKTKNNLAFFDGSGLDTSDIDNAEGMFQYDQLSDLSGISNWNTSNFANMNYMFDNNNLSSLKGLENWNTKNVTGLGNTFSHNQLTDISAIKDWDTSYVSSLYGTFYFNNLSNLLALSKWSVSNVADMGDLFAHNNLTNLKGIENWKTDNLTGLQNTFGHNQINDLLAIKNWKTDKVTNLSNTFQYNNLTGLNDIADWKTDNVTNLTGTFRNNQITNLSAIKNWNTGNSYSFASMFQHNNLTDISPIASWNMQNSTTFSYMFSENQITTIPTDFNNWKTGNSTDFSGMFSHNKLTDISGVNLWDTSKSTDFSYMFYDNKIKDISFLKNWKIDNVTSMNDMFDQNQIEDASALKDWNTSNVTNFGAMFAFNKLSDISALENWNTDSTTDMHSMFLSNPIIYADFRTWNFGKVTNMIKFIDYFAQAIINLGDNNTLSLTGQKENTNIFTSTGSYHFIVTSNEDLLKNSFNAYNSITFSNGDKLDVPVYISAKIEKYSDLYDAVKVFVDQNIKTEQANLKIKEGRNYRVDYPSTTDPIQFGNGWFNLVVKSEQIVINLIDTEDNNKIVKTQTFTGPSGDPIDNRAIEVPVHYELVKKTLDQLGKLVYGETYNIELLHQKQINMIENPATRTITLTLPDGTTREIIQYIDYSRNKTTDLVNGNVTYTGWVVIGDRSKTLMDGKVIDLVPYVLKGDQYYFAPVRLNNLVHVPSYKPKRISEDNKTRTEQETKDLLNKMKDIIQTPSAKVAVMPTVLNLNMIETKDEKIRLAFVKTIEAIKPEQNLLKQLQDSPIIKALNIKVRNVSKFDRTINLARLKAKYAHVLIVKDKSGQAYWIAYDA